jgi:hypothetical protein
MDEDRLLRDRRSWSKAAARRRVFRDDRPAGRGRGRKRPYLMPGLADTHVHLYAPQS